MALYRPNLILILDLDESLASEQTIAEIRRCYSHIGTPIIRKHAQNNDSQNSTCANQNNQGNQDSSAQDASDTCKSACQGSCSTGNIASIIVDTNKKPYLYSKDEDADELWNDVIAKWLENMIHKIGNNMKVFNDRQRKIHLPQIIFERLDIVMGEDELTIGLHTDPVSFVDENLCEQINMARDLINDATLENTARIDMPAYEEYQKQYDAEYKTWLETHPEPEEPRTDGNIDNVNPDLGSIPDFDDKEAYERWAQADIEAKSYENTAVEPTDSDALPRPERPEEPKDIELFDFEVDYSVWKITDKENNKRLFDSKTKAFIS